MPESGNGRSHHTRYSQPPTRLSCKSRWWDPLPAKTNPSVWIRRGRHTGRPLRPTAEGGTLHRVGASVILPSPCAELRRARSKPLRQPGRTAEPDPRAQREGCRSRRLPCPPLFGLALIERLAVGVLPTSVHEQGSRADAGARGVRREVEIEGNNNTNTNNNTIPN